MDPEKWTKQIQQEKACNFKFPSLAYFLTEVTLTFVSCLHHLFSNFLT